MGFFTRIPERTFNELQLDAGVLLWRFDFAAPYDIEDEDIICATTGGINVQCIATYEDMFEDVDNAPNNTMEGKKLTGWDCRISTTVLGMDVNTIRLTLGAADIVGDRVVPRRQVRLTDYRDIYWAGDLANGGYAACKLMNALSTGGFSLQTSKNEKGGVSIELMGHVSLAAQNVVPLQLYSSAALTYTVTNTLTHITNSNTDATAVGGQSYLAALAPDEGYSLGTVTVTMGGTDITSTAYDDGVIIIDAVTGAIVITGTGTANS